MNKTAIRNFAIWARNKLIADVSYKARLMGLTKEGIADALPQSTSDVEFYDIGTAEPYSIHNGEIKQRKSLVELIRQKEKDSDYATAYTSVIEEVAYTWFNRLIAVRFMEVNDYMPAHVRVLSSETGKLEPDIVTTPFDAELDLTDAEKQQIIQLKNDNKLDECFRMLFIKQCNALHELLPRLFENTKDYTELLLNVSFVDQEGVVYHLIHDIEEDDFNIEKGGQVEIIGWMYQYYNSELKDETFALLKNNVKVTKERIPSATQLFTPDWVVRYMVENSLGRLWVEGHTNDTLKAGWRYYLDEAKQEPEVQSKLEEIHAEYAKLKPDNIKIIDPCMGSGHILVYAFDVLMQIYESAGYTQRDAAKSILENNIFGLDIDERAAQLAYFAVLMKARQYNRRILNDKVRCNVYAIRESNGIDKSVLGSLNEAKNVGEKLIDAFADAKEYGSIINLDITENELELLEQAINEQKNKTSYENMFDALNNEIIISRIVPLMLQAKNMVQTYDAVITNPPYMGGNNMSRKLSEFVKTNYSDTKSDMSTVCMEKAFGLCAKNGFVSMINIPVWMFISSYEKLRYKLIDEDTLINMCHLGRGVFGSDFGSTAFVFRKAIGKNYTGTYLRLFNKSVEVVSVDTKEEWFFEKKGLSFAQQIDFTNIPGAPIAYWVSDNFFNTFKDNQTVEESTKFDTKLGMSTNDNNRFLRIWTEITNEKMCTNRKNIDSCDSFLEKWFPYNKGGEFRRWYGNIQYVINWENDGKEVKQLASDLYGSYSRTCKNTQHFFKKAVTWSLITSGESSFRFLPEGAVLGDAGPVCFADEDYLLYLLGVLNSKYTSYLLPIINPTINCSTGVINQVPVKIDIEKKDVIEKLVEENIELSKQDWNSFEMSWDFKKHPMI